MRIFLKNIISLLVKADVVRRLLPAGGELVSPGHYSYCFTCWLLLMNSNPGIEGLCVILCVCLCECLCTF